MWYTGLSDIINGERDAPHVTSHLLVLYNLTGDMLRLDDNLILNRKGAVDRRF